MPCVLSLSLLIFPLPPFRGSFLTSAAVSDAGFSDVTVVTPCRVSFLLSLASYPFLSSSFDLFSFPLSHSSPFFLPLLFLYLSSTVSHSRFSDVTVVTPFHVLSSFSSSLASQSPLLSLYPSEPSFLLLLPSAPPVLLLQHRVIRHVVCPCFPVSSSSLSFQPPLPFYPSEPSPCLPFRSSSSTSAAPCQTPCRVPFLLCLSSSSQLSTPLHLLFPSEPFPLLPSAPPPPPLGLQHRIKLGPFLPSSLSL